MHPDFWHQRWQEGQIGFHQAKVNPRLERHWHETVGSPRSVLVPLSGKSLDLHWLVARGYRVTGVELSPIACAAVFAEHGLTPVVETVGEQVVHRAGDLTVVQGDIFGVTGEFDAVWDRAALIALPPEVRPRYAAHLRTLLRRGARGLLLTIVYPQAEREGPPFSVPAEEVRRLWPGAELIDVEDIPEDAKTRGVSKLQEEVWAIQA